MFKKISKKSREFWEDEAGDGVLVMFPLFTVVMIMMYCLVLNAMIWSHERNTFQIIADSASRAGAVAVSKTYAIKERNGFGLGDYHVYSELNRLEAEHLSQTVIDAYEKHYEGQAKPISKVLTVKKNPVIDEFGRSVPVITWSSRSFSYYETSLPTDKQYKNGTFGVEMTGIVRGYFTGLLKIKDTLDIAVYSQSAARASVKDIR